MTVCMHGEPFICAVYRVSSLVMLGLCMLTLMGLYHGLRKELTYTIMAYHVNGVRHSDTRISGYAMVMQPVWPAQHEAFGS